MNLRIVQMLIINIMLIMSIIFFGNDARTIIILFLFEVLIYTLFRSVRIIRESKKSTNGHLSERAESIANTIAITASVFVLILIFGSVKQTDFSPLKQIISGNMWIIAGIIATEAFFMMKYFYKDERNAHTYVFGYAKLLVALILMILMSPIISLIDFLFRPSDGGLLMIAIIVIISKALVDYLIIRLEAKNTSLA